MGETPEWMKANSERPPAPQIDTSVPHSARVWNYWLGGKDNFEADRMVGDQFRENFPAIVDNARAFRGFLSRAIEFLADEAGIRQFLDIGTGLPTADNVHEVAQRVAPESRIVYVDNDPLEADLHDTATIIRAAQNTLDFDQPIAVVLCGILGHQEEDAAQSVVQRLVGAVPSGSYLVICDGTNTSEELNAIQRQHNEQNKDSGVVYHLRTPKWIERLFDGLELVEPGVVSCLLWRPESDPRDSVAEVHAVGGVGRKP